MTVSLKQRTRLQKIAEHTANGTVVPAELLKIKLSFKTFQNKSFFVDKLYRPEQRKNRIRIIDNEHRADLAKNRKAIYSLLDKNWLKGHLEPYFRPNINNMLVDIANNIGIYDLRLNILFFVLDVKTVLFAITLSTIDKKHNIGDLFLMRNDIELMTDMQKINPESPSLMLPNNLTILKSDKMSFKLRIDYRGLNSYLENHTSNKFTDIIAFGIDLLDVYCPYASPRKHKYPFSMDFFVQEKISCHLNQFKNVGYHNGAKSSIYDFNQNKEIDFIKSLMALDMINIPIDNHDITTENIPYIRKLCKLINY